MSEYLCVCMCIYVYVCVCMCMHVYVCVCMCMYVYDWYCSGQLWVTRGQVNVGSCISIIEGKRKRS